MQEDEIVQNKDLTKQPDYNGGLKAFFIYLNKNFKKPNIEKGNHKTYYSFVIEKDGSISNFKVMRSKFQEIDTEVERIMLQAGKWIPGEVNGKPVRTKFNIPIVTIIE